MSSFPNCCVRMAKEGIELKCNSKVECCWTTKSKQDSHISVVLVTTIFNNPRFQTPEFSICRS